MKTPAAIKRLCLYALVASALTPWAQLSASAQTERRTLEDQTVAVIRGRAKVLLESDAAKDQAWGVYYAGEFQLTEFTPLLVRLLGSKDDRMDAALLRQLLLDSLIRLDAHVPSETLAPLFERHSDEMIILCAKSPNETRPLLLSLLDKDLRGLDWIAINNILTRIKAPEFARVLMDRLTINALINVKDSEEGSFTGGAHTSGAGCGFPGLARGFPPIGSYRLREYSTHETVLFAPGKHPIYFERSVSPAGQTPASSTHYSDIDKDVFRLEYVADLLSVPEESLCLSAHPSLTVNWQGKTSFLRAVTQFRRRLESCYSGTVNQLVNSQLLTPNEASALKPKVKWTVSDIRRNKRVPLPTVQ